MTSGEKPYRVYRGGRVRGKVPALPRPQRAPRRDGRGPSGAPAATPRRRRRLGWGKRIALVLGLVLLVLLAWGVTSYLALGRGVKAANERLEPEAKQALADDEGLILTNPTTVLLIGTDHANIETRAGSRRSDSMMLVRTDPSRNRVAYLSIPRDLRVEIPGQGTNKINAAYQIGGPALAIRTIRAVTGLPVNHVVTVDFNSFVDVIDALGGVTIDVPAPILANKFDCPFKTQQQCDAWAGWRFGSGPQTMNGRRALVYSRVRENRLDPNESDITRGERQQAVLLALTQKLTSPRSMARLPWIGDELTEPLATDLTTAQLLQLGWRRWRSDTQRSIYCRLGGTPSDIGGQSFLLGTEENVAVVNMFVGSSAPQPPLPGSGPFGPGCAVGRPQRSR
jgi:LCP family protein required for cell wall assembly